MHMSGLGMYVVLPFSCHRHHNQPVEVAGACESLSTFSRASIEYCLDMHEHIVQTGGRLFNVS